MGLVFGDIGTSPIYTLTVIFALTAPTRANVLGILSLIFWTLTILVSIEYGWLAMRLSHKGEGGTIVLKEILVQILKSGRVVAFVGFLAFLGVSLLLGDGVITPAISILSAVEGLELIPGLEGIPQGVLILIAAVIAVVLFFYQNKGTDKVAGTFGPVMVVWFIALFLSGVLSIASEPGVLAAASPHHALQFFQTNGFAAFFVLSEVILCATGGEALYADMGHLGRAPILNAWYFVFVALVVNYFGQGAFLLAHPEAKNVLFGLVKHQAPLLYIPFLLLTICATVIASQALISGVFSIIYQAITTRIWPLMHVDFTSTRLKSQIYIGAINWFLLVAVLFIMFLFQKSENLAAAYGLAVTGTMTITGVMMIMIFGYRSDLLRLSVAVFVTVIDAVFLVSNLNKLPHGGYWSLVLASVPLLTILIWTRGQRKLYRLLMPLDWDAFRISYEQIYQACPKIPGTGIFFTRDVNPVPPYVVHVFIACNIVYERNVFICVMRTDEPKGVTTRLQPGISTGLDALFVDA
ncbi:MAG: KUP/HAK/KT family potassium transporter, partial [Deltaproteobacteria bacterium]|nr:KUP/HAK/KT family potassium transporter [Deltaproteobacteria bacterium]